MRYISYNYDMTYANHIAALNELSASEGAFIVA